jgi:dTDP-glucose 4,6-dehydratase
VSKLPARDLNEVIDHTVHVWDDLRGARIFITGVTGFVGSWLLETVLHANTALKLGIKTTALVRDRDAFTERLPHLAASPALRIHVGDVRMVDPPTQAFTHYVHCASASPPRMNAERPADVVDVIENGSQRMIEEAETGTSCRFLQVSSGSVYGTQPPSLERMSESYAGTASDADPAQRFGAAKLRAELRGNAAVAKGVGFVAARMFAIVGPRLPLDGPFAIGNFLGDATAGRTVDLTGDGTPVRSWMYAADMAAWCWTLLARGRAGAAYNVGSEEALSIWNAAQRVAKLPAPPVPVTRAVEPAAYVVPSRYVPSIELARSELGLDAWTSLDDALHRTWDWLAT